MVDGSAKGQLHEIQTSIEWRLASTSISSGIPGQRNTESVCNAFLYTANSPLACPGRVSVHCVCPGAIASRGTALSFRARTQKVGLQYLLVASHEISDAYDRVIPFAWSFDKTNSNGPSIDQRIYKFNLIGIGKGGRLPTLAVVLVILP